MLKNKYAQYVLVPLLVIVWGTLFYKIYMAVKGENDEIPTNTRFTPVNQSPVTEEAYVLLSDYKDPFLGKSASVKQQPSTNYTEPKPSNSTTKKSAATNSKPNPRGANAAPPAKEEPKPVVPLPELIYHGWLLQGGDTVSIVKINKQFYPNLRKNDLRQKVKIEAIFRDSIQVSHEGRQWTVVKEG